MFTVNKCWQVRHRDVKLNQHILLEEKQLNVGFYAQLIVKKKIKGTDDLEFIVGILRSI